MSDGPPFRILSTCKGGGYRYCRTDPPHPRANAKGLYPLHRVLAENRLGRLLAKGEVVHHEDEDKANDKLRNLKVKTRAEHSRDHAMTVESVVIPCAVCGSPVSLKPAAFRLRMKRNAAGGVTCSRTCGATMGNRLRASA